MEVCAGSAYLVARHKDMIQLLKKAKSQRLDIGSDIGLVVCNDDTVFEILDKGITAISIDFREMGRLASEFVMTREKIQEYIPTSFIFRGSL